MNRKARTSVIVTVRNEVGSIDALLDSLAAQHVAPSEVVVVDGGSTDGTLERLEAWSAKGELPLTVVSLPGAGIAEGRNVAVERARCQLIACTDAGVRLDPRWLERLTRPLHEGASLAAGFFRSDPRGAFETALGAATLPLAEEVDPATFLPSSRSAAFRRQAWLRAGGYPEWLDYCEDLVFDFRAREAEGPWVFVPGAVAWFRPRTDLGAFARQYYLYARGDGKADLWRWRHAIRYATYLVAAPLVALWLLSGAAVAWLALAAAVAGAVYRPYRRLVRQWSALSPGQRLAAAMWVPVIRLTGDVAKMAGYPVGRWWRHRNSPPRWRPSGELGHL